jgi:hypothetical protein
MPLRDDMAQLRGLCGEKGFDFQRVPGGAYRLVRIDIGHAVMHPTLRRSAFSLRDAITYLRSVDTADI